MHLFEHNFDRQNAFIRADKLRQWRDGAADHNGHAGSRHIGKSSLLCEERTRCVPLVNLLIDVVVFYSMLSQKSCTN